MRNQSKKQPIKESSGVRIRQCAVYEPDFKKAVVSFAEQKGTSEAKKRYGISESNIRRWRKIENKRREISLGKSIPNIQQMVSKRFKRPIIGAEKQDDDLANQLDSMPLNERLKTTQNDLETVLQSQPLSPTKLKVTRQNKQSNFLGKFPSLSAQSPPSPPAPVEEISLKWNSYQSNMQSMFPNLLSKEQYVDVTLVADGRAIKCHRVILSSCSPYFEETLSNISPFQHPVLFLKDVSYWVLKTLCDFMYTGEVKILQPKLEELLTVADNLKIKGLAGKPDCANDVTTPVIVKSIKEEKTDDSPHMKEKETDKKDAKEKRKSHTSLDMPVLKNEKLPSKIMENNEMPLLKRSKLLKFKNPLKKSDKLSKNLLKESVSKKDILDPFDLLEPVYEEVQKEGRSVPPVPKVKENKNLPMKKSLAKKVKKRKITEERDESPPPIFLKKGTRSRPLRKIPKYYDIPSETIPKEPESLESTIVREPHTHQTDPLLQPEDIKTEPLDLDENIIEIEDNVIEFNDDITLQEEDVIGDYDCSLISFERDKINNEKLPIKDVKIVDVTQIKDSEEGSTELLEEDPLNINQTSESTITITDIHSLVENKEDNLDNVCNELGFRISEIHSQTSISVSKEVIETEGRILGFQMPSSIENEEEKSNKKVDDFKILIGSVKTDKQTLESKPNTENVEFVSKNVIEDKLEVLDEKSDIVLVESSMKGDKADCVDTCSVIEAKTNFNSYSSSKEMIESPRNNISDLEEVDELSELSENQLKETDNQKTLNTDSCDTGQSVCFKSNSSVDDPIEILETEDEQLDPVLKDEDMKHTEDDRMDDTPNNIHQSEDDKCVTEHKLEETENNLELNQIQNDTFQYSSHTVNNQQCSFINEVTSSLCNQDVLMLSTLPTKDDPSHSNDYEHEKEFVTSMTKSDTISVMNSQEDSELSHKIDCTNSLDNTVEAIEVSDEVSENHIRYTKEGESSFSQECIDFSTSEFNMGLPAVSEDTSINDYGQSSFKEDQHVGDANYVNSVYKENEMETIVNDLTKIVSESQNELSSGDTPDDIEESLANLLK